MSTSAENRPSFTRSVTDSGETMRTALARQLEPARTADEGIAPPGVPDHELLQPIGAGAYGEVWLARNALGTMRAVKLVYQGRFEEERPYLREFHGILKYEPVSRSHEGLVAVLHVGRNDEVGCFYYVMELADDATEEPRQGQGEMTRRYTPRTLRTEMAKRRRLPPAEAAQLVLGLAGALAHLHAHGLVHRDVKPSNVIFVRGKPKLADIGLVTGAGDSRSFVGTEGFIPPEGPGSVQADLYGLGKLLYELASGRDRLDFPQLPPELGHQPADEALLELNEIIIRACNPDPQQRYQTATEFVSDLNLFLAGRSLRQVHKIQNNLAWLKRFAAVGAVVVLLAAGAAWLARSDAQAARRREQASRLRARVEETLRERAEAAEQEQSRLRKQAQAQELSARKRAYASDMNLLQQALATEDLGRAQELLGRQQPAPGQADLRGWEWRYFWQFCQSDAAFVLCRCSNSVVSVSFSRDGRLLAAGTWDGEATVWDTEERRQVFSTKLSPEPARLAFAPNRDLLVYYSRSNAQRDLVVWDSRTKSERGRLPLKGSLRNLAFTDDGRLFTAEFGATNNINEWDVIRGTALSRASADLVTYGMGTIFNVAKDGRAWVYAPDKDSHAAQLVERGTAGTSFRVAEELVTALAYSPDGRTLYTGEGYAEGEIKEWDIESRQHIGSFTGHRSWVSCLKFLPDRRTLASASADHTIRLWDTQTHRLVRTLRYNGELWTLDISPDGRWLAGGCKDGSVILWDLSSTANRPPPFRSLNADVLKWWAYSPDSRWCGIIRNGNLDLYDAVTLKFAGIRMMNVYSFAFAPDMHLLVTSDDHGRISVWTFPALALVTNFPAHATPNRGVGLVFMPDGKSVLSLGTDDLRKEWDAGSWQEIGRWPALHERVANALSPAARLAAYASESGATELVNLQSREPPRRLALQNRLSGLTLSPDGATLADASENGTVELWDTHTLQRKALLHGVLLGYHSVAISPDGSRLAAGSNGQEAIKLWDLEDHEELATLAGRGSFFRYARFSPDGQTITACNWNGEIHFWTAPTWEQINASAGKR